METTERNQINIEDEMRRSYLDYAMSVIIGRALPDVRDGLKPVHRRVLWAMHELGNQYNKAYKKSARVVGDCFVKGALVHTENGLTPIEEINVDDYVRLADGSLSKVVEAYHNPPAHVVDVTLSNGLTLTVTPGQKFRVLSEDLTIAWEEARNLKGKRVLVTNPRSVKASLPHPDKQKSDLAYVCGLAVAEGYSAHKKNKSRVNINMTDAEPIEFLTEFCATRNDRSFFQSVIAPKKAHYKPQYHVAFSGVREAYEASSRTSAYKTVPAWILADRRLFAPFVAGFTDGDGYIRESDLGREVILASASKTLLTQIQSMLADSGIHGKVTKVNTKNRDDGITRLPAFTLSFTGEQATRFCSLVHENLKISRKRQAALLTINWSKRALNTMADCLPNKAIFAELSRNHLGGGWYLDKNGQKFRAGIKHPCGSKIRYEKGLGQKEISYRQLQEWEIFDKLDRINSPLLPQLQTVVENYCVLKVVSVEDVGEMAETYDIQIEHELHEFVLHGCAVSNCIGKYHPHGDTAVYDTIVRMAQDFSLRYPLIDGQGNFGSVDGDAAAAMRYTEVRMARFTTEVLADIEKETVDFNPNYDESLSEPSVLPTRIPNLLVNGSDGIAVGMATKIPPHNLTEIVDATIALLKKPTTKLEELLKIVTGPDFPTGGFIYGREEIKRSYTEGRGIIQMRARAGIDRIGRGTTERDAIIITEIPFQVNKARLIERIAELVNEKKLEGIADLRDESDRDGMRIVVELKRDAVAQVVLNKLYKMTPMQSSFGVINLAIVNGQPRVLNLKQMLEAFVDFRREVVRRRTEYELRKARARAHILEGLTKAIDALDFIVTLIRNARSVDEARQWLTGNTANMIEVKQWKGAPNDLTLAGYLGKLQKAMQRLEFSEIQAQAILDLQLRRLSALERQKIVDEYEGIIRLIAELEEILANESALRAVIAKELEAIKKEFGDKRRTEIVDEGVELSIEDMIADEDVAITITNSGYIKRTPITTYTRQGRGGKGRFGAAAKGSDFVEHLFIASTHAYLMIFTDNGQVFKLKVHEVPDAAASARGKAVVNLISIPSTRKLAGVVPVRDFAEGRYVMMVTRKGTIKKTSLADFQNIRTNGINAINIDDGDELLDVVLTDGTKRIFIATHNGLAIRFDEKGIRPMGRATRGVRGIALREDDYVVSLCAVSADDSEKMLSVSEQGYGKQTKITDYRFQSRGGKGVINMKATEKTGKVVAVFPVDEESEIMIITQQGKLIRIEADSIRKTGRSASGVRLIKTDGGDKVTSASLVDPASEEVGVEETAGG